ncbi:hypothetical protein K470DRAFT_257139 [Piedraia hortae CBS 480.64]|uniref:Nudix hydrolase domain-containing protein n=1 Tax=Piedraia hortae CBS 480.64 TaxID=1314780 RepID=A0A6A7C1E9_9PEZI|nr:hypothetical protein K470DRAFT_257139 [Piedraia hortae CBS 480.64]
MESVGIAPELVAATRSVLEKLTASPYAVLESPESTKRRASVAFILRIRPSNAEWPMVGATKATLGEFFDQSYVQHGEPEVLFIKRAARKGDKWTSHIALPGGKRDSEDVDDQAAAIRETWEEVGLDLNKYSISCGNLPQRLVTTHWGKKPLMVLCPYVFLLSSFEIPPLRLQPSEVASTHWVPIRSLLSPRQRTVVFEDMSSRIANQETGVKKWMLSMILGKMMFAAINLVPTESLHSVESPADGSAVQLQDNRLARPSFQSKVSAFAQRVYHCDVFNQFSPPPRDGPLLLWGLTLGVVSDFLDLIPPHNALTLWSYPNFTPLDVRFAVWLMTYRFKERKRMELQSGTTLQKPSFGAVTESVAHRPDETGFHGLGTGSGTSTREAAVSTMLEGYYDIVRKAVGLALVGRVTLLTVIVYYVLKKLRRL